jgi:hypothetical protein
MAGYRSARNPPRKYPSASAINVTAINDDQTYRLTP